MEKRMTYDCSILQNASAYRERDEFCLLLPDQVSDRIRINNICWKLIIKIIILRKKGPSAYQFYEIHQIQYRDDIQIIEGINREMKEINTFLP